MSRSCKIAVSQQREHCRRKGPSCGRPAAPTLLALGSGWGGGGDSAPPLSEITADTCQGIHPQEGARLIQITQDEGLQAHSQLRSMSLRSSFWEPKAELLTLRLRLEWRWTSFGLSVFRWWPRSGSVGPAALFSLQLSYVLFMPFVECPALRGHRWQRQAEDNEGRCQLALQDLAVGSVRWPQSGRGETIPGLPAGPYIFDRITPSPAWRGSRSGDLVLQAPPSSWPCLLIRNRLIT